MTKDRVRKLKRVVDRVTGTEGQNHVIWRNSDGTFGEKHWSREQFDVWEKSLLENDVVYVIGWNVSEETLPDGSGVITVKKTEEKHEAPF